jgi:hypothetical protein
MTYCRVCREYFKAHLEEWDNFEGPYGYAVVAKVGLNSYKCQCYRCGHIWRTNSKHAAFQFNEPRKFNQIKAIMDRFNKKLKNSYDADTDSIIYFL